MEQDSETNAALKLQINDLKTKVSVVRRELKNIRIKLATLEKIHKRYVNEIIVKQQQGLTPEVTDTNKQQAACIQQIEYQNDSLKDCINCIPIGYLESPFLCKNATPRQSSVCQKTTAKLKLLNTTLTTPSHALQGLEQFSHIWLIFVFHQNKQPCSKKGKVKPPRLNGEKVGVFATRSPHRVNPIGLSLVKLDKIEGDYLYLSGIDMIDGTPIIDIKPYIPCYDGPQTLSEVNATNDKVVDVVVPEWIQSPSVQQLNVRFTPTAEQQLQAILSSSNDLQNKYPDIDSIKSILVSILKEDPRSIYRRSRCTELLYYFKYDVFHLTCWVDDPESVVEIIKISSLK